MFGMLNKLRYYNPHDVIAASEHSRTNWGVSIMLEALLLLLFILYVAAMLIYHEEVATFFQRFGIFLLDQQSTRYYVAAFSDSIQNIERACEAHLGLLFEQGLLIQALEDKLAADDPEIQSRLQALRSSNDATFDRVYAIDTAELKILNQSLLDSRTNESMDALCLSLLRASGELISIGEVFEQDMKELKSLLSEY